MVKMGEIYFDIAALCLLGLNFYLFFSRSRLFLEQTRIFALLLAASLLATTLDLTGIVLYRLVGTPLWVHYAVNTAYYLAQNGIPLIYALFIIALSGRQRLFKRRLNLLILIPWLISLVVVIPTFRTGWAFSFDTAGTYHRGPLLPLLYGLVLIYTASALWALYRGRSKVGKETLIAILLFIPLSLIPVLIQYLYPLVLVQNLGIAYSELFILMTVLDFGRFSDPSLRMYNPEGFLVQMDTLLTRKKPFTVFIIHLDATDYLLQALGPDQFSLLEKILTTRLFGGNRADRFAARSGSGQYLLAVTDPQKLPDERHSLETHFHESLELGGRVLSLSGRICEITLPRDTQDIQKIFQAQYQIARDREHYPVNRILSLEDLNLADTGRLHDVSLAIRRAVTENGFQVFYQPIVSAETEKTVTAEALIRLKDPRLGWISPAEFIPVAEQNGTIHRLGDTVLEQACGFLADLRSRGLRLDYIEINLSALQCVQSHLTEKLLATVRRHRLDPEDLCLEITETAANLSPGLMKKNLEALAQEGFRLAIDDFGTGYSNISGLMDTRFSVIKLDRSLFEEELKTETALKGLSQMFRNTESVVVAEGIETPWQRDLVRKLNIGMIQGFLYSRPLPPDEFAAFISREGISACHGI